jgi:GNAT superfamily N-acetyltransferase
MAAGWSLRKAGPADADSLALIGSATFLETFAGLLAGDAIVAHCARAHAAGTYRHILEEGGTAWLAEAEPGGAPIGYALLAKADLPGMATDGSDLELKRIYALSRFHGSGLGAELMRSVIAEAEGRGAKRLLLGVFVGNKRARAFYARQGFSEIAERRFQVGEQFCEDVVLARSLQS